MNIKRLSVMLTMALSVSMLSGCSNEVSPIDNKVETNESKVEQTEQQLAIKTAQDHFDYTHDHQERVMEVLEDLDAEINESGKKDPVFTEGTKIKMDELEVLINEYINFDNKITQTEPAGEDYQKAMIKLNDFISKTEEALKDGTYSKSTTGVSELMEVMAYSIKSQEKFEKLGVKVESNDLYD